MLPGDVDRLTCWQELLICFCLQLLGIISTLYMCYKSSLFRDLLVSVCVQALLLSKVFSIFLLNWYYVLCKLTKHTDDEAGHWECWYNDDIFEEQLQQMSQKCVTQFNTWTEWEHFNDTQQRWKMKDECISHLGTRVSSGAGPCVLGFPCPGEWENFRSIKQEID